MDTTEASEARSKAVRAFEEGALGEAESRYLEYLALVPDDADALLALGLIASRRNRAEEAIAYLERCRTLAPGNARALATLGGILRARGRHREAVECYRAALDAAPDRATAQHNLAIALHDIGDPQGAAYHFERALAIAPGEADAWHGLGVARARTEDWAGAEDALRRALEIDPEVAPAWFNLGNVLTAERRLEEANEAFRMAIDRAPDLLTAHNNLGGNLAATGDWSGAKLSLERALALKPDYARAWQNLANLPLTPSERSAALVRLEELLAAGERSAEDLESLHYARGRLCEQGASHEKAFAAYRLANESRAKRIRFGRAGHKALVRRIIETFDPSLLRRGREHGVASDVPVFVVGMPRSGTSLAEQIIASHPEAFGAGELDAVPRLCKHLSSSVRASYPECVRALSPTLAKDCAHRYLRRSRDFSPGAVRITDKLPSNFLHLGLIALLLPGARVVHCLRDPRDVLVSNYFQGYESGQAFSYRVEDIVLYLKEYRRLMVHWERHLPLEIFPLRYEALVEDQEKTSRDLIEFCGLRWDDACLAFERSERPVHTASQAQVRRPLYKSALGRWRHYAPYFEESFTELEDLFSLPP